VKRFQNVIGMLHSQISAHRNGNIFHNPIKDSEAPDYREIVKRPMDLKTIKAKIKDGGISNSLEFQRAVYLMFANAMMYNRPNSDIYTMTEEVRLTAPSSTRLNLHFHADDVAKRTTYLLLSSNGGPCAADASPMSSADAHNPSSIEIYAPTVQSSFVLIQAIISYLKPRHPSFWHPVQM
jgi:hypothetical protein